MFTLRDLMVLMTSSGFKQVEGSYEGHLTFKKEGLRGIYLDFFTEINKEGQTVINSGHWMDEYDERNNVTLIYPDDDFEGWRAFQNNYKALRKKIVQLVEREEAIARLNKLDEEEIQRLAAEAEGLL